MYDCIIIGAGPAGLTSGIYLARAGKKTLILDKQGYGGQIINALDIENYPGSYHIAGFDLVNKMYEQALDLGCEYHNEEVISIENNCVITNTNKYFTKTIIIATGCYNRKLGLENEDKFIGKGISYCATCDGAFFRNKIVAVYGGGNTAIDDAYYLSNIAQKIYLIYRGDHFKYNISKLEEKDNIEFILSNQINGLIGDNKLEGISLTNHENITLDGLFIAIGQNPNTAFVHDFDLNDNGYFVSSNCETKYVNIFVAGDVRDKELRQLVTATSDGAMAANKAINYLNKVNND